MSGENGGFIDQFRTSTQDMIDDSLDPGVTSGADYNFNNQLRQPAKEKTRQEPTRSTEVNVLVTNA